MTWIGENKTAICMENEQITRDTKNYENDSFKLEDWLSHIGVRIEANFTKIQATSQFNPFNPFLKISQKIRRIRFLQIYKTSQKWDAEFFEISKRMNEI